VAYVAPGGAPARRALAPGQRIRVSEVTAKKVDLDESMIRAIAREAGRARLRRRGLRRWTRPVVVA
jgi:hypothetical protein